MKKLYFYVLMLVLLVIPFSAASADTADTDWLNQINWDERHHFDFYEKLLNDLSVEYPNIAKTYPIGHTWRERPIMALELSSNKKKTDDKTGIAILANIHGGEQESGEAAAYTAWWLATNYDNNKDVKKILDNYTIYVVPVINPDGYEQSFIYNTRQNLRPTDHNGDGKVFSDPYTDVNGDGFISEVYIGGKNSKIENREFIGMESPDWDKNGKPGDDPKRSNIDMNRTFDYMWNRLDVDSDPVIGANSLNRAGSSPASEPEIQAVQNFLISHPVNALATLHTGIQCVLWPWCYTPEEPADAEFMKKVGTEMAQAFAETTGRKSYAKQSYDDYPTNSELIDWAYGRLGIRAYTMEVYRGGLSDENGSIEEQCAWDNELPEEKWEYIGDWNGLKNVWFKTTARAQMSGIAPPEQALMLEGTKNAMLKMIKSEPHGSGPKVPEWLFWGKNFS